MSDRTFSHSQLGVFIKKLHLEPGDCLIVSKHEIIQQLQQMPAMAFHVPVILVPEHGGIQTATRQEILDILERMDEAEAAYKGIT